MPTPSHAFTGVRLSRRTALAAAVAGLGAVTVGCTPERGGRRRGARRPEEDATPVEPQVDPDVTVATEALRGQEDMIGLLRATTDRHRRLAALLAPALATHEAHASLLAEAVPERHTSESGSPTPSTSPTRSPAGQAEPGGRRTTVPRNPARAVQELVEAERGLAATTKQHAFNARSGAFARVLGSMAAAAAQHATVLGAPSTGDAS